MGLFKLIIIFIIAFYSKDKMTALIRYFNKYDFIKNNKYLNIDNYISEWAVLVGIIGVLIFIL